jgi:hypothetical protein
MLYDKDMGRNTVSSEIISNQFTYISTSSPAPAPVGFNISQPMLGTFTVVYPAPGTYTFQLIATDNDQLRTTEDITVIVKASKYHS